MSKQSNEIIGNIMHFLDATALLASARVSRRLRHATRAEWRDRVYRQVEKHVKNGKNFFELLGKIGGVISGSSALAVIAAGSRWENKAGWNDKSDMDAPLDARDARRCCLAQRRSKYPHLPSGGIVSILSHRIDMKR